MREKLLTQFMRQSPLWTSSSVSVGILHHKSAATRGTDIINFGSRNHRYSSMTPATSL